MLLSSQNRPNSTTITSGNGTFSFPVDPTTLVNATVSIPVSQANSSRLIVSNGTVYNCSDSATNQTPLFTLSAQVPENSKHHFTPPTSDKRNLHGSHQVQTWILSCPPCKSDLNAMMSTATLCISAWFMTCSMLGSGYFCLCMQ